jgi:hypothetical protein
MGHLYGCKRLDNSLRPHLLDLTNEVQVVRKGEIWMTATHHMNLPNGLVQPLPDLIQHLIDGQDEAALFTLTPAKSTESAAVNTDIAIVNVLVVDPVGFLTVKSLSHHVSQKSNAQEILRFKESETVFPR